MTASALATGQTETSPGLVPLMLSHAAWVTHDVERTAQFYTGIMGMALASTVYGDKIPSTGDAFPYFHIFFRMQDGSTIAFFEAPDLPARSPVSHPAYEIFDHIALQASDHAEVDRWHAWLTANDIDVVGPTDHDGLIYSIYFKDPNGLRLEITAHTDPLWNRHEAKAEAELGLWLAAKRQAKTQGRPLPEVMRELLAAAGH